MYTQDICYSYGLKFLYASVGIFMIEERPASTMKAPFDISPWLDTNQSYFIWVCTFLIFLFKDGIWLSWVFSKCQLNEKLMIWHKGISKFVDFHYIVCRCGDYELWDFWKRVILSILKISLIALVWKFVQQMAPCYYMIKASINHLWGSY